MEKIAVESMTAAQLQSLALGELGDALASTMVAIRDCGSAAISARAELGRLRAARSRGDPLISRGEHDARIEEARAIFDSIQTLIRAHV